MSTFPRGRAAPRLQRLDSLKNPQPRSFPAVVRKSPPPKQQRKTPINQCPNPDCHERDIAEEEGQLVCRGCGTVVQESNFSSEVTWSDNPNGAAVVQGSFLGPNQAHARGATVKGYTIVNAEERRALRESEARRYMDQLAAALKVPAHLVDKATQWYRLALGANFIQGRRIRQVAAVCLYVACRHKQSSQFMLIDFADILHLNVFKLGQAYRALYDLILKPLDREFRLETVDPAELIPRFAGKLEFGQDTPKVAKEAVKIVQRMNRDWLITGRKPNGICGAALVLAARMNNYRRTVREVIHIVKVTEATVHKRLDEFKYTRSSGLTINQFRAQDSHTDHDQGPACDPPAFYEKKEGGKHTRKRKRRMNEQIAHDIDTERAPSAGRTDTVSEQATGSRALQSQSDTRAMPPPPIPIDPMILTEYSQNTPLPEISSDLSVPPNLGTPSRKRKMGQPPAQAQQLVTPPTSQNIRPSVESEITVLLSGPVTVADASILQRVVEEDEARASTPPSIQQQDFAPAAASQNSVPDGDIIPEAEFANDPEVISCLLSPDEIAIKERLWIHENADYLRIQNAKELSRRLAEENGTLREVKRRQRHRNRVGDMTPYLNEDGTTKAKTVEEQTALMLKQRGFSKKINYPKNSVQLYEPSERSSSCSQSRSSVDRTETRSRLGTPVASRVSHIMPENLRPGEDLLLGNLEKTNDNVFQRETYNPDDFISDNEEEMEEEMEDYMGEMERLGGFQHSEGEEGDEVDIGGFEDGDE